LQTVSEASKVKRECALAGMHEALSSILSTMEKKRKVKSRNSSKDVQV
jgi:hypothetical protein